MPLANSKIIPAVFWVGFLALGFVTSLEGPKRRVQHAVRPASAATAPVALVAQGEKPVEANAVLKGAAQD